MEIKISLADSFKTQMDLWTQKFDKKLAGNLLPWNWIEFILFKKCCVLY